jgi:hypothetical protein
MADPACLLRDENDAQNEPIRRRTAARAAGLPMAMTLPPPAGPFGRFFGATQVRFHPSMPRAHAPRARPLAAAPADGGFAALLRDEACANEWVSVAGRVEHAFD